MKKNKEKDVKANEKNPKRKKPTEGIVVNPRQGFTSVSGGDSDSDSFPEPEPSPQ